MKLLRAGSLALVNLVVFLIAAEAVALATYYWQRGWLFYASPYRKVYTLPEDTRRAELATGGLHPYFGPTHRPGIRFDVPPALQRAGRTPVVHSTNNFGFVSGSNYPVLRSSPDQFFIGILGGSVANWFCEVGATRLVDRLKQNQGFAQRELVPICLAHEGYKQPQQLLVLSYFLAIGQPLDLVINIAGFNEVALGGLNQQRGWDVSMPSVMHLDPLMNLINETTMTPEKLESATRIRQLKDRLVRLAERINRTRFASVYVTLEQIYAYTDNQYRTERLAFQRLPSAEGQESLVHVTPPVRPRDEQAGVADGAREWATAAVLSHDLLSARGVPYFDILQPNQYATSRPFSSEEEAIALSGESPFKAPATAGYPLLKKELSEARRARPDVRMLDATAIFDRASAPVYMDNCCHYTLAGNDLLADFIAEAILAGHR